MYGIQLQGKLDQVRILPHNSINLVHPLDISGLLADSCKLCYRTRFSSLFGDIVSPGYKANACLCMLYRMTKKIMIRSNQFIIEVCHRNHVAHLWACRDCIAKHLE